MTEIQMSIGCEMAEKLKTLIDSSTYAELVYLERHAPVGFWLFLDNEITAYIRAIAKQKAQGFTPEQITAISKAVNELPEWYSNPLMQKFDIENFSKPLPADEVGNTKNQPKTMKLKRLEEEKRALNPADNVQRAKEEFIAKKAADSLGTVKGKRVSVKNAKAEFVVAESEPDSDSKLFAEYFAMNQTRSEIEANMKVIKTELINRAKERKMFNGSLTASFDCGGKVRVSVRRGLVIPKDLESTRFYTHEAMQDLLEVVPNEKEILVILDSEDHELHDTLASMGFEVKSTESVTLLP
jgi:hypothetical protein